MQISHLDHGQNSIWCRLCGQAYPVQAHVLRDGHRTIEAKENVARRHKCQKEESTQFAAVRVYRRETAARTDLDRYWSTAIAAAGAAE